MRVLVVDDCYEVASAIATAAQAAGHFATTASSGEAALLLLDAQPAAQRFDFALIDMNMPGMLGDELVGHLRARGHTFPVGLVTALAPPDAGAVAEVVVIKPFGMEALFQAFTELARAAQRPRSR